MALEMATTLTSSNQDVNSAGKVNNAFKLQDITDLCIEHCRIKDVQRVEDIISEMITGGCDRLQVVSDFDFTITKQRKADGSPVLSSFGMFNACRSLPKEFIEKSKRLYHKYHPIEIDPYISYEDKVKYMIEWWNKSDQLLMGFSFDKSEIDGIAAKYKDSLRDRSLELFQALHRLDVPVLVFSAGLGDSVVSVLKQAKVLYPNMKVISNFLQYKDGLLNGFGVPIIHTFNKNETVLEGSEYYDLVHQRDHILVMGDSLGDADMANGMPLSSHVLKIGFLYNYADENLERYMDVFDIVLIDDQTMNVPLSIISAIETLSKQR